VAERIRKKGRIHKRRKKLLRGVALYETLLAIFLFSATTLALVASTAGIYRLNEDKGALNSAVAGSHSLIEQILAADFNSSLFYNQQSTAITISGTEVPATANIPGLSLRQHQRLQEHRLQHRHERRRRHPHLHPVEVAEVVGAAVVASFPVF